MDDFPDVNVWVALSTADHPFHVAAKRYFESDATRNLAFSWVTAIGLLRVTCHRHTFGGEPLTPKEAWQNYIKWRSRPDVVLVGDAENIDSTLNRWVTEGKATAKNWTDLYLAAFATAHGLRLVTFDRDFKALTGANVLVLST